MVIHAALKILFEERHAGARLRRKVDRVAAGASEHGWLHTDEIDLVVYPGQARARGKPLDFIAGIAGSEIARVKHEEHVIGLRERRAGAPIPSLSTGSDVARKPAVSVKWNGNPPRLDLDMNRIARGARHRSHDRAIFARQAVQETGLADIRGARDHYPHAIGEHSP